MVGTSPSNPGGMVSIPGQGAKILHGSQSKNQNMKQKKCCKDFKKKKKELKTLFQDNLSNLKSQRRRLM